MKPILHSESSARKFGGKKEDYLKIHDFMDSSKAHIPDHRHRCIFHSSFGIYIVEAVFGTTITNSDSKEISVRDIAEQHVLEDLGTIPTLQDYLKEMNMADWMGGPSRKVSDQGNLSEATESVEESGLIKSAKETVNSMLAEIKDFVKDFESSIKDAFKNIPDLAYIVFQMYTPGFNDGDACEHSMGDIALITRERVEGDEEHNDYEGVEGFSTLSNETGLTIAYSDYGGYSNKKSDFYKNNEKLADKVVSIINSGCDIFKRIYGTDIEVCIDKNLNVTTASYDCGH